MVGGQNKGQVRLTSFFALKRSAPEAAPVVQGGAAPSAAAPDSAPAPKRPKLEDGPATKRSTEPGQVKAGCRNLGSPPGALQLVATASHLLRLPHDFSFCCRRGGSILLLPLLCI